MKNFKCSKEPSTKLNSIPTKNYPLKVKKKWRLSQTNKNRDSLPLDCSAQMLKDISAEGKWYIIETWINHKVEYTSEVINETIDFNFKIFNGSKDIVCLNQ